MKKIFIVLFLGLMFMVVGCAAVRTGHILRKDCKVPKIATDCQLVYHHNYQINRESYEAVGISKISCKEIKRLLKGRQCIEKYKITIKSDINENPDMHHNF